ncbi:hypothetical protein XBJ2_1900010 [Xenorhabdus bovienii str. Jollieti]|uniref:Uncharacterized protein n=1 Tax=Xenorhabdus bovienii (strain SS-2004) TaxID=406818 RepID=D3V5E6_XENBS|nr:hypothetical protein XBJ1_3757 [Xenorhabdus bovienii SS-2004]CDH28647.1 hypothetical protein XBJ2_1900010 [Xenorhabdus bovienii str. Jollieti]
MTWRESPVYPRTYGEHTIRVKMYTFEPVYPRTYGEHSKYNHLF